MLEWLMIIAAVVGMSRTAEAEQKSGLIWGAITFGVCMATVILLPGWPFVRILGAVVLMFALWIGYRISTRRRG